MATDYAQRFYRSRAWRDTQAAYMASRHYVCERCGGLARIVHHKRYINAENVGDPAVTLDWANLEAVCIDCHNTEHMSAKNPANGTAFDKDGNIIKVPNVFLVCGCPGSGKSSYVARHKTRRDLVVDLDYLCAALMGEPGELYLNHDPVISVALEVRTLLYEIISTRRGKWERAFVVTSAPHLDEQRALARDLNAEIIMIDTPLDVCLERLQADGRRAHAQVLYESQARKWWQEYSRSTPPAAD